MITNNNDFNKFHENLTKEKELTFDELFDKYVPKQGKADTIGGEIIRAANRIIYRYYNDGDMAGFGYGKETVNPACRYLLSQDDENITDIINGLFNTEKESRYEGLLIELERFITDYVQAPNLNLLNEPNDKDYQDFATEEDKDDEGY